MMSERSLIDAGFTIEKTVAATPAAVFRAFSDAAAKAAWFSGPPDWDRTEARFDFREGGIEVNEGGPKGGPKHRFEARYHDIIPNERIVYTYQMWLDGRPISVSLTSIELKAAGAGTRIVFREQGAFLDGREDPALREQGSNWLISLLAEHVERDLAQA
jgi:uncharacterized protein YndB with AHSA1/START domain